MRPEFLAFVQLCVSSSIALLASVRRRPWRGHFGGLRIDGVVTHCSACGYSLVGLAQGSLCPECGASHEDQMIPLRLIVDPERLRRWWLVLLVNVVTVLLLRPSAYFGLVLAYGRDGIDAERAGRWVLLRELGLGSSQYVPPAQLMFPLVVVTTVVIPLSVMLPRRGSWVVAWVLAGVWLFALVWSVWDIATYR